MNSLNIITLLNISHCYDIQFNKHQTPPFLFHKQTCWQDRWLLLSYLIVEESVELFTPIYGDEVIEELLQLFIAIHELFYTIGSQLNSVVGHSVLRKVIRSDLLIPEKIEIKLFSIRSKTIQTQKKLSTLHLDILASTALELTRVSCE